MKAITLRNIPPELAERIEAEAERTGASLNATVLRILQEALLPSQTSRSARRRDLSGLGGGWTEEEADEFDRFLAEHRKIDPEMWQ